MNKKRAFLLSMIIFASLFLFGCVNTDNINSSESSKARSESLSGNIYTIKCYNVGKGDAFLIYGNDSAVMIDTGYKENGEDLVDDMKDLGIDSLDCMMISHFDKDHVGGAVKIIKNMEVKRVISTYQTNEKKHTNKFFNAVLDNGLKDEVFTENTSFTIGDVNYDIYPPQKEEYDDKEDNNSSLLVKMTYGDFSMLFTGDAQTERLSEYSSYNNLASTVLKFPYHGHYQDYLSDLIKECDPKYAIITSSDDQPEDELTVQLLENAGVSTYLTRKGDVIIQTNGSDVSIKQ